MKYVQFEVKTGEGRKKQNKTERSQEKRLMTHNPESQPELEKRGPEEKKRSGTLRTG